VFLDEHPDSIGDGYFIDQDTPTTIWTPSSVPFNEWRRLPASYHNRSAAFSFADGHATMHRWLRSSTLVPPVPDTTITIFPITIPSSPPSEHDDFEWVMEHMSVEN
jgi:prepilin-type processing-associated H-X9-DG protein